MKTRVFASAAELRLSPQRQQGRAISADGTVPTYFELQVRTLSSSALTKSSEDHSSCASLGAGDKECAQFWSTGFTPSDVIWAFTTQQGQNLFF